MTLSFFLGLLGGPTNAMVSDQTYDAQFCASYGGFAQWNVLPHQEPLSACQYGGDRCPRCIQYCYSRQIICRNGQNIVVWSQLRPYASEAEQSVEWSAIQAQEQRQYAHVSSTAAWESLSPIPQFLILGLSIALMCVAWRGLGDDDWRMAPLGIFNLYLPVSLLFFNTTAKGSSGFAYWLDTTLFFHSWLFLLAAIGVVAVGAVPFAKGWDYYFVKHPAADIVNAAVDNNTSIDGKSFASALTPNPAEIHDPLPSWHYEHQAEKARKLKEKLDRDAELARSAVARERARAELQDEQEASAADARERVRRGGTLK